MRFSPRENISQENFLTQALNQEKYRLREFNQRRLANAVAALLILTNLVLGQVNSGGQRAFAGQIESVQLVQSKENQEKFTGQIEIQSEEDQNKRAQENYKKFLENIYKFEPKEVANKGKREIVRIRTIKIQLEALTARRKLGFPEGKVSTKVSPEDIKKTLNELKDAMVFWADQLNNKDGKVDKEDMEKLAGELEKNPNLKYLVELFKEYKVPLEDIFAKYGIKIENLNNSNNGN